MTKGGEIKFVTSSPIYCDKLELNLLPLLRGGGVHCVAGNLLRPHEIGPSDLVVLCPPTHGIDLAISRARRLHEGGVRMALLAENAQLDFGRLADMVPLAQFIFIGAFEGPQPDVRQVFPDAKFCKGEGVEVVARFIRDAVAQVGESADERRDDSFTPIIPAP